MTFRKRYSVNTLRYQMKLFSLLGGKCVDCDERIALQVHHIRYLPGEILGSHVSFKKAMEDPSRFMLLCRIHHMEFHKKRRHENNGRLIQKTT